MKKVYMFLIGFIIIGVISFSLLKDTEKNCSYCLYSNCPVRRGAQKEEGDN